MRNSCGWFHGKLGPKKEYLPETWDFFIADEAQSGIVRARDWFALEHFNIEPDVITTAKSLGGGLPIVAVMGQAEIMDAPAVGTLGSTFANRLRCLAALALLRRSRRKVCWSVPRPFGEQYEER